MTQALENILVIRDSKGKVVAFWSHEHGKGEILYQAKQASLSDIQKLGTDLYLNNCAESLILKSNEKENTKRIKIEDKG